MKTQKIGSAFLTGVMALSMIPMMGANVLAASDVAINTTNFPDKNFRSYVSSNFDKDSNGKLSADEIKKATYVSLYNKSVSSLKGIEYLTGLTSISAGSNELTSVDFSKNTKLKTISLGSNKIKSINLTKNTALEGVYLGNNQLTALDISKNTKLQELRASDNKIAKITFGKNTALKSINLDNNLLTSINLSSLTNLEKFDASSNKITSVTVNNKYLKQLDLFKNSTLTKVDVTKCPALEILELGGTKVSSINVKSNKYLRGLGLSGTKVSSVDVTANKNLEVLYVDQTSIKSLNVTKNPYLGSLKVNNTAISSLDLSKNKELYDLDLYKTQIKKINIANCSDLVALYKKGVTSSTSSYKYYYQKINSKYCTMYVPANCQIVISNPTKTPSKSCISFVERMYTTCLKRKAETAGRDYWANKLCTHEMSGEWVAACFFMSDELKSKKLSNDEFVNRLYATFMDREPDSDGKGYWVKFLNDGNDRLAAVMGFSRSPEFIAKCEASGILPYMD